MEVFAWWLALGLANLANALDPSVIVLGGGLIESQRVVMGAGPAGVRQLAEAPGARGGEDRAGSAGRAGRGGGRALLARKRAAARIGHRAVRLSALPAGVRVA